MDEGVNADPYTIKGNLIDLYDPNLPVIHEKQIKLGEQGYFYNVDRVVNKQKPQVLATAARIYDEKIGKSKYAFTAISPLNTINAMRVLTSARPKKVVVTDAKGKTLTGVKRSWDAATKTQFLSFDNNPEGVKVVLSW
jgi:hypothetical protein